MKITKAVEEGKIRDFHLKEGVLWHKGRLCVLDVVELNKEVMKEAHNSTSLLILGELNVPRL